MWTRIVAYALFGIVATVLLLVGNERLRRWQSDLDLRIAQGEAPRAVDKVVMAGLGLALFVLPLSALNARLLAGQTVRGFLLWGSVAVAAFGTMTLWSRRTEAEGSVQNPPYALLGVAAYALAVAAAKASPLVQLVVIGVLTGGCLQVMVWLVRGIGQQPTIKNPESD